MTYTATQALAELDKFPAFKGALVEAIELGAELQRNPARWDIAIQVANRMARIGSMVELRGMVQE